MGYRHEPMKRRSFLIETEQGAALTALAELYRTTESDLVRRALDIGLARLNDLADDATYNPPRDHSRLASAAAYAEAWAARHAT